MTSYNEILTAFGFDTLNTANGDLDVFTPIDGSKIATLTQNTPADMDDAAERARAAYLEWRKTPAPIRGEFVRLLGQELRESKDALGQLVTLECGKLLSEGLGEVQEMIDICDFAVGLSRQLYGLTIGSERPQHHMRELWHPLGAVGVITAFNFPVAVWSWNAALAFVCGDSIVWKPSEKTPLTALACQQIFERAVEKFKTAGHTIPDHLNQVIIGGRDVGQAMSKNEHFPLISATGSVPMGKAVAVDVAARLADMDMAVRAILFGAVGTCGQRCTSSRRLIVHKDIKNDLVTALTKAYQSVPIGDPLDSKTLIGPLIDQDAQNQMLTSIKAAQEQGGQLLTGGEAIERVGKGAYVTPAIIDMPAQTDVVKHETFAPILYVLTYDTFDDALALQNDVPQGLSSAVFTANIRESEYFLSAQGSDCGIANVNIGTSGAEIGGAFGGEKETGGGRESGSDSWKIYMRRQTQTVNFSTDLPLAQGVKFDL